MKKKYIPTVLFLLMFFSMAGCFAENDRDIVSENSKEISEIYPPYPDVWHYISKKDELSPTLFWALPSGDVVVAVKTFMERANGKRVVSSKIKSFFTDKEYRKLTIDEQKTLGFKELQNIYGRKKFKLSENEFVLSKNMSSSGKCSNPLSSFIESRDSKGNLIKKFRLLYLPSKLEIIDQENCEGGGIYHLKVKSLRPMFTSLVDNTFIISSYKSDAAIRFKNDFTTNSKLNNERFFIVPFDVDPYSELRVSKENRNRKMDQEVYFKYLQKMKGQKNGKL